MSRTGDLLYAGAVVATVALGLILALDHCAAAPSIQEVNAGLYATGLANCERTSYTRAEEERCEAYVRAEWCGDGGAWAGQHQCTREGGL